MATKKTFEKPNNFEKQKFLITYHGSEGTYKYIFSPEKKFFNTETNKKKLSDVYTILMQNHIKMLETPDDIKAEHFKREEECNNSLAEFILCRFVKTLDETIDDSFKFVDKVFRFIPITEEFESKKILKDIPVTEEFDYKMVYIENGDDFESYTMSQILGIENDKDKK